MRRRGLFYRKAPSFALPPEKIDVGEILGEKPLLSEKRLFPRISPKRPYLPSSLQMRLYSASSRR